MQTTLNAIRKHRPCTHGWQTLLAGLNKTAADDEPLPLSRILEINGLNDTLWALCAVEGYAREMRLFAVWCARQVAHLNDEPRVAQALDVATRYANGEASDDDLQAACTHAAHAAHAAYAAYEPHACAAHAAAHAAANTAAHAAVFAAGVLPEQTRSRQNLELRRVLAEIEAGRDPYPTC